MVERFGLIRVIDRGVGRDSGDRDDLLYTSLSSYRLQKEFVG
jgi:hypothetical protein